MCLNVKTRPVIDRIQVATPQKLKLQMIVVDLFRQKTFWHIIAGEARVKH